MDKEYSPPKYFELFSYGTRFLVFFVRHNNMTLCTVLEFIGSRANGITGVTRRNPNDATNQAYADRVAFRRAAGIGEWNSPLPGAIARDLYSQFRHWQRYGVLQFPCADAGAFVFEGD